MDATPPPAPPTLVSTIDQAQREALARMAAFQSWLLAQQDALPDPAIAAQDKREFFHDIDTFWDISHEGSSRRPLFARHMAQAMRDDAGLHAASGDLSYKDIELVRQLTDIAATLPRHVHASELMVGGTPYPGALVAWDDARSDDILLFLPDQGWSVYDTLDGLLYDMADRMHEQARMANGRPPYAVTGDNEAVLAIRPIDSDVVATLTDGLIVHFRTLQQEAWDANPDTSSRIDALHDTLRLFMLVDPHALLDGVDLLLANRRAAPTHAPCSPPASTARTIIRGTGRHLGVAGGRVGVQASRTLFHRVGTGLPGRLPASRSVSPLAPSNTLFNERYVAHGVTMPANAPQIDGVFLVGNARYVRQGNQLYAVRFDSSLQGWRLQRHGALDAQYAGPPIRRAADGSWELWQDAGLLGGAPRKDVPRWQQLDRLTDEQRRRLQSVLAERLGLDEGGALYRRMAARPPEGIRSPNMPRAYRDIWREAMEAALPPASPPGAPPPLPRPMAADVAGLSAIELEHLQHLLNRRLGYMEGLQAFHELAYPRPASMPGPSVSPEALGAWNEALAAIQTLRQQQVPVPIPPNAPIEPTRVKTADIADLSRSQRERLRSRLRVELGTPRGRAVYADMAYRPLQGTVAPAITPEEMDIWRATLAEVRLPHSGARSVVVPELIDLGRHQLETLRRRMVNTLGEVRGSAVYKAKALRSSIERAPMDISAAEAQTWERLLAAARSHPYRHQPGPDIAADLADLSAAELGVLRIELKRRLGFHYGEDIYLARSRRTSDTRPAPVLSTEEANAWHEALAVARAARHAPPPATMAGDEVARRLWHVPRSDWPETIYYYAPAEDLEAISDMVILISQRRLGTVEANGIPLFTAPPSTRVNQMDSIASSWLPAGASDDLGSLTGAWLRIDLRAAAANIHPSFDLFRLGSAQGNAFVLRPTAQSASMGTGERALWLFGHYSAHRSPP